VGQMLRHYLCMKKVLVKMVPKILTKKKVNMLKFVLILWGNCWTVFYKKLSLERNEVLLLWPRANFKASPEPKKLTWQNCKWYQGYFPLWIYSTRPNSWPDCVAVLTWVSEDVRRTRP